MCKTILNILVGFLYQRKKAKQTAWDKFFKHKTTKTHTEVLGKTWTEDPMNFPSLWIYKFFNPIKFLYLTSVVTDTDLIYIEAISSSIKYKSKEITWNWSATLSILTIIFFIYSLTHLFIRSLISNIFSKSQNDSF